MLKECWTAAVPQPTEGESVMDKPTPISPRPRIGRLGIAAWLLFGWATQPFYTVLMTFIYAPYFATAVAADPAEGRALWGLATSPAGLVVGVRSPPARRPRP